VIASSEVAAAPVRRRTTPSRTFERVVAVAGLTAALMALLTLLLGVLFVGASLDMLADPSPMLGYSSQQSEALRWANVTSLLGFGALLLPVVFYVAARLHALDPRVAPLAQAAGVGYVTFAGINAAMLLSVWPAFQQAYPLIDPSQRAGVEVAFRALTDAAEIGMQALAYLLGGGFWILSGMLLRGHRPWLGLTSIALGLAAWAAALGLLLRLGPVATVALGLCFILTPLWSGWIGILALRHVPLGRRVVDVGPPDGIERRHGARRQGEPGFRSNHR
jgi:hypothetical protein